jgi:hypothetical protein
LSWSRINGFFGHGLTGMYSVYPRRVAMLVLAAATSILVRQARYTRQQFYCNFVTCNVRTSAGLEVLGASVDSMQLPWAKMQVSFCMTLRATQEDCTESAQGEMGKVLACSGGGVLIRGIAMATQSFDHQACRVTDREAGAGKMLAGMGWRWRWRWGWRW